VRGIEVKIWFQKHTVIGRNPWLDAAYESHFTSILPAGTEVAFGSLPAETYAGSLPADYVRYGQLEVLFSWYFAHQALEAERQGYDAYVIGTSQDPGLRMARSLVSIPVVGYGEATFGLLHGQGIRFGVVGFIAALEEALTENLAAYGAAASCVGFAYIPSGKERVAAAMKDGDVGELLPVMSEAAESLRARGAQAIVPGEGLPNEALWAAGVRRLADLPFIDADGIAVTTAETLARGRRLGLWNAGTTGYHTRRAPAEEVERLRRIFAPAVAADQPIAQTSRSTR
jgi:allantoin racemase